MKKYQVLLMLLLSGSVYAQQIDSWVIGAGGESSGDSKLQLSWTLGEVNVSSTRSNNIWITEGFHQSYPEMKTLPFTLPVPAIAGLQIYPNPATDQVHVNTGDLEARDFDVRLLDPLGNLILYEQHNQSKGAWIPMRGLPAGLYIVSIHFSDESISGPYSFKIIKQ